MTNKETAQLNIPTKFQSYYYFPGTAIKIREYRSTGPISFRKFIGWPLSDDLWNELIENFGIKYLGVYDSMESASKDMFEWISNPLSVAIICRRNETTSELVVDDIILQPWYS